MELRERTRRAEATCPYCREVLAEGDARVCTGCGASYHPDCLKELGRCATLGCETPYEEATGARTDEKVRLYRPSRRFVCCSEERPHEPVHQCQGCQSRYHASCLERFKQGTCCEGFEAQVTAKPPRPRPPPPPQPRSKPSGTPTQKLPPMNYAIGLFVAIMALLVQGVAMGAQGCLVLLTLLGLSFLLALRGV